MAELFSLENSGLLDAADRAIARTRMLVDQTERSWRNARGTGVLPFSARPIVLVVIQSIILR
jgi:hypothetical protein